MTTPPVPSDVVRVSGPQGIIGSIPYLLGFHPEESLVMLCLRGERNRMGPVLRLDLPAEQHASHSTREQLAQYLAIQADQHADSVMLVCYSESPDSSVRRKRNFAHAALVKECIKRIERTGIHVFDAALVRDRTCVSYLQHSPGEEGFPLLDVDDDSDLARLGSNHAGTGRAVLASREELRRSVAGPTGSTLTRSKRLLRVAQSALVGRVDAPETFADLLFDLRDEHERTRQGEPLSDRVANIVAALDDPKLRDEAIYWALHHLDDAVVPFFISVATWTPDPSCAQICTVLAIVAYRQGDGALAQVAVDRVLLVDPSHRLCGLLLAMMQAGMPPHILDAMLTDDSAQDEYSDFHDFELEDDWDDSVVDDDDRL